MKDDTPTPELPYSGFNTPTNRWNLNFGKKIGSGDKIGFNIAYKNQDAFLWQAGFAPTTAGVPFYSNTTVPAISK